MIIAIAIHKNTLNTPIHTEFGRCSWLAIYDNSSYDIIYLRNPEQNTVNDAGLKLASLLISKGVSKVVAGRFGLKAANYLREQRVQMIIPQNRGMTWIHFLENVISR